MNRATKIAAAILVMLALGLAVLAIILGRQTPAPVATGAPAGSPSPSYPVVVADADLAVGVPIEANQLKVVNLSIFPTGTKGDIAAIVGKKPVRPIPTGRPVYDSDIGLGTLQSFAVAEGERAISITVEEASAANRINPGDFVDVFFVMRDPGNPEQSQARLLLSRVRVMLYGSGVADNLPASPAGPVVRPAVLAVPLPEVPRLLLATQHGRLALVLRSPGDEAVADANLFEKPGPVLAPRPGLTEAQLSALREPSNLAFAGISLGGLASPGGSVRTLPARAPESVSAPPSWVPPAPSSASPVPRPAQRAAPTSQVEIIRGTQTEVVPF